ncbi:hypothetical protein F5883DRAFT_528253 [Diaporthe sp. PMI_573]|nr:hypothetical protein F5883DRAFT_528253 [Diaporthaceae sp. PMI_573]
MAAIIATTVLAVFTAWVRLYTRFYISKNIWWDDWVMLIATFLIISTNSVLCEVYNLGLGRHIVYIAESQIPRCFMFLWIAEPTNLFALYAVRVFFLRLVPQHRILYRRAVWGVVWALTISDIYVSINYFIQCRPIQKVWEPRIEGTCLQDAAYQAGPWFYQENSVGGSHSSDSYQVSDRFARKAENAIYRDYDIERSSGPAEPPCTQSEDSILPRTVTNGQVETRVQGPDAPRSPPV